MYEIGNRYTYGIMCNRKTKVMIFFYSPSYRCKFKFAEVKDWISAIGNTPEAAANNAAILGNYSNTHRFMNFHNIDTFSECPK